MILSIVFSISQFLNKLYKLYIFPEIRFELVTKYFTIRVLITLINVNLELFLELLISAYV